MEHRQEIGHPEQAPLGHSHEWSRLILKLRWIGLEDDAHCLEMAVKTLQPESRGSVSFGPFSTD